MPGELVEKEDKSIASTSELFKGLSYSVLSPPTGMTARTASNIRATIKPLRLKNIRLAFVPGLVSFPLKSLL